MFGGGRGHMSGGGGMLRAASRAMTRAGVTNGGIQEPFSSSSSLPPPSSSSAGNGAASNASHGGCAASASRQTHKLSSSSGSNHLTILASGSPLNLPVAANSGRGGGAFACVSSGVSDEFEWVSEEGSDDEFVFGPVPSVGEVEDAVSALQQVFEGTSYTHRVRDKFECNFNKDGAGWMQSPTGMVQRVSSFGSDLDWMEPSMQLCNPRMLQTQCQDQVYNAFHLLRTEPSVQRMVVSLSSDKAIWDAVMNNEVVREIREFYNRGMSQEKDDESSNEKTPGGTNPGTDFVKWVLENTKAKAMDVFEKITKLVTEFFKIHDDEDKAKDERANSSFEEKLRTSVLLSIVVLLVVVVSRASLRA